MILFKLFLILIAICLYVKGETETKWLGKSNKNWKMALGKTHTQLWYATEIFNLQT